MEGPEGPELSPGGWEVVHEMTATGVTLVTEQSSVAVEVGHEGLDCQLRVDGGLEMEHGSIGILCDSLEHLIPRNTNG